jgi:hypothetical protein
MSAPNVTITVEPTEAGAVVYLPLAPSTAQHDLTGALALKLWIRNNEASTVHVDTLTVSFTGGAPVSPVTVPLDLDVDPGAQVPWFYSTQQIQIIPVPAPPTVKLGLAFKGFADPATVTRPLKAHASPTPEASYGFPAAVSELRAGEYWFGSAATHAPAGDGGQLFAYDMTVVGWDGATGKYNRLLPGKDNSANENFRIWGKRIRAAANGTVVAFANDRPTNPKPGVDLSPPDPVEGNHFYLQHGDELMLYAHLQKGTLNSALTKKGAVVKTGDFLGLSGNSGNSSEPHLHVHTIQATQPWQGPLRPLPFHGIQVVEPAGLQQPPDPAGLWSKVDDQGLPRVGSLIWPAPTKPTWYPPGWAELSRHGIPEASYQTEFDHITSSGYQLVWIDGYDVGGKTFFNAIFRPSTGVAWVARHGLDGAGYQAEFDKRTKDGFRLAQVETYLSGGNVRYAAIFTKAAGPGFVAYHGRNAAEHQKLFDDLGKQGFRPVNIAVVSPGGQMLFAGLYEQRDVGSYWAKSAVTPAQYQVEFDDNKKAGRRLVYLDGFTHQGGPRISAIWHEKPAVSYVARHGLDSAQYQAEFDKNLANGYLTRAVTGYEDSGPRFAAYWSK